MRQFRTTTTAGAGLLAAVVLTTGVAVAKPSPRVRIGADAAPHDAEPARRACRARRLGLRPDRHQNRLHPSVPAYTAIQAAIGVPVAASFDDITSDPEIVAQLASVYADVDDVDPVVGMLAEDREGDAMFGRTALALYELQFEVTRDSDRFWYERVVDEDKELRLALQAIGLDVTKSRGEWTFRRTLAELILDTTSIGDDGDVVQLSDDDDAFHVR